MVLEILCFSHLRWDFVYQRPQHLLSRFADRGPVHFWEEPVYEDIRQAELRRSSRTSGVTVLTPLLPVTLNKQEAMRAEHSLLDRYLEEQDLTAFIAWYYTPMALSFSEHLQPVLTVYDCMDELSAFDGAPPELVKQEKRLFDKADIVFAGGASLYASKRKQHPHVMLFPSSIDHEHFGQARAAQPEPTDQAQIQHPRIGFFGVLDERLDRELVREVAAMRPDWHSILIGPVAKIRKEELPHAPNLHYLGQKTYAELPAYLAGWDVAILPFAQNASTRFISPTKTPEYLAGGKPVVSTPIRDVVSPYGERGLVEIARTAGEFVEAIERSLGPAPHDWMEKVDEFLSRISWDKTFQEMWNAMQAAIQESGVASRPQPVAMQPSAGRGDLQCSTI